MGLHDLYEFALVADDGSPPISTEHWPRIQHRILHLQPATYVELEGDPPRAIRVRSIGGTEVAPGLLRDVARLASTSLHVEVAEESS